MLRSITGRRLMFTGTSGVLLLLLIRVPSLLEPAGGDQSLYAYVGERILAGDVPYRDAWDQKPPAVHFVYASLWRVWPHDSVVPAADLAAAGLVAWLLIVLGRRTFGPGVGYGAACLFLLLGNPWLQRLSGVRVRSQCETFIALAVTTALVLVVRPSRRQWQLVLAGVWLAVAFWLKYNAALYAVPLLWGAAVWSDHAAAGPRRWLSDAAAIGSGFIVITLMTLTYFAAHGALDDLRLATIDYNLRYSGETYAGPLSVLAYLLTMPVRHAGTDGLWFVGGVGSLLLLLRIRDRSAQLALAWLAAAILSIAANGARGLPQYFVQAAPALAFAAAAGLSTLATTRLWIRIAAVVLLLAGLARVGDVPTTFPTPRLLGLPDLIEHLRYDLDYARGRTTREAYLARFQGDKYFPLAIEQLARHVRETTGPEDRILVFGFSSGGVYVNSERSSASRFFWSRPIVIEFGRPRAGYGSAGLLLDLERRAPAIVALQKHDWGIPAERASAGSAGEPNSRDFFMSNPSLHAWLTSSYVLDEDTPEFAVWRRRP